MCVLEDLYRRYGPSTPEGENLRRGQELLRAGEYEQSLGYFDLAQQHPKTSSQALEGKLEALLALEKYDDAHRTIDAALKDFPDNVVACRYRALLYAREDRTEDAIACLDHILAVEPDDENAHLAKSALLVKKGDYQAACRTAEDLLARHPDSEAANFEAAKTFFALKQYDKALSLFGKVVRMNPSNASARKAERRSVEKLRRSENNELRLALTLLDNKMYADSLHHFADLLARGENTAEIHYFLGKAYKGLGETDRMIEAMQQASELAPRSTAPLLEIGEQLLSEGKADQAMKYFDRVLKIEPSNRQANMRRGEYLQHEGRPGEADSYYDRILDKNNQDAEAYLRKGITAMDRYPAAGNPMLYFDKAMEADPTYALPMYYRGQFQLLSGQKTRYALESFNKAAYLAAMSCDEELLEKCRKAIRELTQPC